MSKVTIYETPMLDELEQGEWPSFISSFKRLRDEHPDRRINTMLSGLLGQLEHSYETRMGWWKGGTVSVFGYGGGSSRVFQKWQSIFPNQRSFTPFVYSRPLVTFIRPIF